jgi:hypothetical protein
MTILRIFVLMSIETIMSSAGELFLGPIEHAILKRLDVLTADTGMPVQIIARTALCALTLSA